MKKAIILSIFFLLIQKMNAQQLNYKTGDTLHIFTNSGLKLRDSSSVTSKVLASMKLGDNVVVQETENKIEQIIEGFTGHWVKVKYGTTVGFAFDGFLSSLPIPRKIAINKEEKTKTEEEIEAESHYKGHEIERLFEEYIKTEFHTICEPVHYYNGYDGESLDFMELQKLNRDFTIIRHAFWEGWGTELQMPGIRFSEIKNLIILLAYRSGSEHDFIEEIKDSLKNRPEGTFPIEILFSHELFRIRLTKYIGENATPYWSLEFICNWA